MVFWPQIKSILAHGTLPQLRDALACLERAPSVTSMYQTLEELWNNPEAREVLDLLLSWGSTSFKFLVIRHCIMMRSDSTIEVAQLQLTPADEEQDHVRPPRALDPEILAERILQKDPQVIRGKGDGEGMNLLHYAVEYDAENLIAVILKLFKDKIIEDPEDLLAKSSEIHASPLVMMINRRKLGMFRKILQDLPAMKIHESILLRAIDIRRDDMLLALVELRPDCVSIKLMEYCISFQRTNILNEILNSTVDRFIGHGLLHYAVREGNPEIIERLLLACPDFAIEDVGGISPLRCLQQEDVKTKLEVSTRQKIRDMILPSVIRRAKGPVQTNGTGRILPINQIRKLLADPEDKRREISLDLGGFRHSSRSIEPFLKMIKSLSSTSSSTKRKGASLLTVEFESTLRYVDIPIPPFPHLDVDSHFIPERVEAKLVLGWLRESKDVSGIYELRIRDSLYLPHGEEVISQCLSGFDIEVLDWMRVDMSVKPLIDTCHHLKKLTLYVSTWTSLSYWVSGDGYEQLNEFPELRDVEIFILADLIGSSYSSKYEQDARRLEQVSRDRLAEQEPQIKVEFNMNFYLRSWGSLTIRQDEAQRVKKSTAVEITQLGAYIEAYTLLQKEFQDEEFREENNAEALLPTIVKVAIIDTGVDPDSIKCSEIGGVSFVLSESGESPWWFSYHSHGTQMAKVITELNPCCRLLVAKVGDSVMDMTVDRVIQALEWAIKSKADIISISAAFFKADERFEKAIQNVIAANIVLIASTAGEAYRQEKAYPADYDGVLKIAATDYRGRETPESLKEHADFMFPGENIVAKTTFLGESTSTDEVSGTSVATAIASGTASLVLACHRLSLSKQHNAVAWENHESLKRKVVKEVFTKMMDNNSGKFVKPWLFFGDSTDQISWGEASSTLSWLSRKEF